MTDRIHSLIVVLEKDVRDDDIQPLLTAIEQIRGVLRVDPNVRVGSSDVFVAEARLKDRVREQLWKLIEELR